MGEGRVYLPVSRAALAAAREHGSFMPPLRGHAVTPELVDALPDADEEEREYAAMQAAAHDALTLLAADDRPRRLVAAVDAGSWDPAAGPDDAPSLVEVTVPVPMRRLASVHADSDDAADDVRAAVRAVGAGAGEEDPAVERSLDHELGWYAAQELGELLDG